MKIGAFHKCKINSSRVLSFLLTWFAVRPVKWYTQNFESGTCSVVAESWLWLRCRCQWFDLFWDNAVKTLRNYIVVQTFLRQQEAARIWEYHFKGRNQIDWLINCSLYTERQGRIKILKVDFTASIGRRYDMWPRYKIFHKNFEKYAWKLWVKNMKF